MHIERDAEAFRPITIRIETQDELDMLHAVVASVAENRVQHTAPLIRAAIDLRILLSRVEDK